MSIYLLAYDVLTFIYLFSRCLACPDGVAPFRVCVLRSLYLKGRLVNRAERNQMHAAFGQVEVLHLLATRQLNLN